MWLEQSKARLSALNTGADILCTGELLHLVSHAVSG